MIYLKGYEGKHVAVLGMGKSGRAAADALRQSGAHVVVWDDGEALAERAGDHAVVPYEQWPWEMLACVVMSPGIPLTHPAPHPMVALAAQHDVRITSDITLLMEACAGAFFIGITGTNGKSTTTALITYCLEAGGFAVQAGGNIGTPALALAQAQAGDVVVLELSSYQLDLFDRGRFNIACLLNITPDHLDRHGGLDGYIAAKRHIFDRAAPTDIAIIATDDRYTQMIADEMPRAVRVSTSSANADYFLCAEQQVHTKATADAPMLDLSVMPGLQGRHNHQNALVALAACNACGMEADAIAAAMTQFRGLAHRMEQVATIDGVRFVNDSKATNADAAMQSLRTYQPVYWIVGGVAKDGGITTLTPYFSHIIKAYIIGETPENFSGVCADAGLAHVYSRTIEQAVADAFDDARGVQDAVILCAPSAASFDQFSSFEARGDAFKAAVLALK